MLTKAQTKRKTIAKANVKAKRKQNLQIHIKVFKKYDNKIAMTQNNTFLHTLYKQTLKKKIIKAMNKTNKNMFEKDL